MPPEIKHPRHFLPPSRWDDWVADRLVTVFGSTGTTAAFMAIPLIALLFSVAVQNVVFFLASGWIQLWALPLLNYAQNKADVQRSAKAESDHQALLVIKATVDDVRMRLDEMGVGRGDKE